VSWALHLISTFLLQYTVMYHRNIILLNPLQTIPHSKLHVKDRLKELVQLCFIIIRMANLDTGGLF
jgi:hypothetical protein